MKVKGLSDDDPFKDVGSLENPLLLKMPEGSWREYAGGSGAPLYVKQLDGTWKIVTRQGRPTSEIIILGPEVVSVPPFSSIEHYTSADGQVFVSQTNAYPYSFVTRNRTEFGYESVTRLWHEFSVDLTDDFLNSKGWSNVNQASLKFTFIVYIGDPSGGVWAWEGTEADLISSLTGTVTLPSTSETSVYETPVFPLSNSFTFTLETSDTPVSPESPGGSYFVHFEITNLVLQAR